MLTPVDIQQKKFKMGFGYDKKDVNKFFEEVYDSYAALYRSNAELKEKVITFNDRLQHYKTTEENLQKSLLLAEKNTQEQRSNAEKEAKAMELEARSRAEQIVKQASIDLKNMNIQMDELREQYAAYKSKFAALLKEEFEFLGIKDFDTDSYINPRYTEKPKEDAHAADSSKGTLGSNQGSDISSSANVYGSVLGGEGIDPFHSTNNSTRTVNTSGHRNTQTTNKYSVNNDDDGISPTINLFRDSEKTYKEAKQASNARTKEDNIFKNAAASRINPERSENSADVINFAAKKSSSETTKSDQFENKKGSRAAESSSVSQTINNSTADSSSSASFSSNTNTTDISTSKEEKTSDVIENRPTSDSLKRIQDEDDLVGDIVLEAALDDIQDKTPDKLKIDDQESIDDDDDEYFIFT